LDNLSKAKSGIENLILTYTDHPETISNLRVHIINIDLTLKKHGYVIEKRNQSDELQKIIDTIQIKKTIPTPIPNLTIEPSSSFKRFTPKDYIEKHILSSSHSSSETPLREEKKDELNQK
jgi:hypothetical protein